MHKIEATIDPAPHRSMSNCIRTIHQHTFLNIYFISLLTMRFSATATNDDKFSITNGIKLIKQLQIKNEMNVFYGPFPIRRIAIASHTHAHRTTH